MLENSIVDHWRVCLMIESESDGPPIDIVCEEGVQDGEEKGGSFARAWNKYYMHFVGYKAH